MKRQRSNRLKLFTDDVFQGCGPCQLLLKHSAYRRMLVFLLGVNRQNNQVLQTPDYVIFGDCLSAHVNLCCLMSVLMTFCWLCVLAPALEFSTGSRVPASSQHPGLDSAPHRPHVSEDRGYERTGISGHTPKLLALIKTVMIMREIYIFYK